MADPGPFELGDPRSAVGAVVVHGYTGSPYEVRPLGEALAGAGLHVVGPALAGHETRDPRALVHLGWKDWYASLVAAYQAQRRRHQRVLVVGFSMGGLLALHLAAQGTDGLAGVAVMGVPLWLPRGQGTLVRAAEAVAERLARLPFGMSLVERAIIPKKDGQSDLRDPQARRENPTMPAMPLLPVGQILELGRLVERELGQITVPTFVAHGGQDHTAPPACAEAIARGVRGPVVRMELPESYHLIALDVERARLARGLVDWVQAFELGGA